MLETERFLGFQTKILKPGRWLSGKALALQASEWEFRFVEPLWMQADRFLYLQSRNLGGRDSVSSEKADCLDYSSQ